MRELFLESFCDDADKVYKERLKSCDKEFNEYREKASKIFDEFWETLTKEQQGKYREFELEHGAEQVIINEDLYAYALKKGMAIGFEIGKSFK